MLRQHVLPVINDCFHSGHFFKRSCNQMDGNWNRFVIFLISERDTKPGRKTMRSVSHGPTASSGSTPGNRIEQQHSWPPHDIIEPQPLGKNGSSRCVINFMYTHKHMTHVYYRNFVCVGGVIRAQVGCVCRLWRKTNRRCWSSWTKTRRTSRHLKPVCR